MADAINREANNLFVSFFLLFLFDWQEVQLNKITVLIELGWGRDTGNGNNFVTFVFYHVFRALALTSTVCPYFLSPENLHIVKSFHSICT